MGKIPKLLLLSGFLLILNSSCKEDNLPEAPVFPDFWEAHHQTEWDSASTANELIGTWRWIYEYCCPESSDGGTYTDTRDENLVVEFSEDSVRLFEDGDLIMASGWSLQPENEGNLFGLETMESVPHLFGRMLFAENMVLFNGSILDGPDNVFEREE